MSKIRLLLCLVLAASGGFASVAENLSEHPQASYSMQLSQNAPNPHTNILPLGSYEGRRDSNMTEALVRELSDRDANVRWTAAANLGQYGRVTTPSELPALLKCLEDSALEVRTMACQAILSAFPTQTGAGAALPELTNALASRDGEIRAAARAALKEKLAYNALERYLIYLSTKRLLPNATEWILTIRVIDELGNPVSNALVQVNYLPSIPERLRTEHPDPAFFGNTGANGIFSVLRFDESSEMTALVRANSYFETNIGYRFEARKAGNARHDLALTAVLNRIPPPIPMYASIIRDGPAVVDTSLGYDLMSGDWVAPYGKGKRADIIFTKHVQGTAPDSFFQLTVTFPNKADGIREFNLHETNQSTRERLYDAPDVGYESQTVVKLRLASGNQRPPDSQLNCSYYIRVHTGLDGSERVKSTLYGYINGVIVSDHIRLVYFINPTPNDRNLRFEMGKSLVGK